MAIRCICNGIQERSIPAAIKCVCICQTSACETGRRVLEQRLWTGEALNKVPVATGAKSNACSMLWVGDANKPNRAPDVHDCELCMFSSSTAGELWRQCAASLAKSFSASEAMDVLQGPVLKVSECKPTRAFPGARLRDHSPSTDGVS